MSALLGLFFIAGLVWLVWALVVATRRRNNLHSTVCPQCRGFKLPRADRCFTCTTR